MDKLKREDKDWFYSYKIIFDLSISSTAKLVYLSLCRFADGNHTAYPSYKTIGRLCGIKSNTTIKKAIDTLMECGLLDYRTRTNKDGDKSSNFYTLYNKPNERVIKKYKERQGLPNTENYVDDGQSDHDFSLDIPEPDIGQGSPFNGIPCPINEQGMPNTELPYSSDGQPHTDSGQPGVHLMDNPCPLNEHKEYPSKNRSFKNPSINQDGRMDHDEMEILFKQIGLANLHHTGQIPFVRAALTDLLETGKIGKSTLQQDEILSALTPLTADSMDSVLDRFITQMANGRIPRPTEYIKACMIAAGREASLMKTVSGAGGREPSYDIDEYVGLSMRRLLGKKDEADAGRDR